MKMRNFFAAGSLFLVLSSTAHAQFQTGADFFAGKWNALVRGTPYGDLKRIYILDKKDNGLNGTVLDSAGKEISKCSKIDVKDNEVTLYYTSMGNEVSVVLTKKDQDHLTGKGLGTFDVTAERIKQKLQ